MHPCQKNLFLTGPPSSGKTTIIKKVISSIPYLKKGFYTEEEKKDDKRVGFLMHNLDGESAYLAHQEIESIYRIRRYGVSLENIKKIAVPSIDPEENYLIIIDEIGKMECFSDDFIKAAKKTLDSPNIVLGTITLGGTGFISEVKEREDLQIFEVTEQNRDELPKKIIKKIDHLVLNDKGF